MKQVGRLRIPKDDKFHVYIDGHKQGVFETKEDTVDFLANLSEFEYTRIEDKPGWYQKQDILVYHKGKKLEINGSSNRINLI